jgi:hypothetical protein
MNELSMWFTSHVRLMKNTLASIESETKLLSDVRETSRIQLDIPAFLCLV